MAWTTPQTWADGNVLTAAELNEQVRDNLNFLFSKPSANYVLNEAADYTTTSTTYVDVDATNLALTITTGGGDVLIWFNGMIMPNHTGNQRCWVALDIDVDGSRLAGDDGLFSMSGYAGADTYYSPVVRPVTIVRVVTGLTAGSHTFALQWKVGGTAGFSAILFAGAGTTSITHGTPTLNGPFDSHGQFGVREL